MTQEKEDSIIKLLKIVFTVIAVISIVFVFYNIGLHTDNQGVEVFAGLESGI